jgi:hypothetical protein
LPGAESKEHPFKKSRSVKQYRHELNTSQVLEVRKNGVVYFVAVSTKANAEFRSQHCNLFSLTLNYGLFNIL